MGKRNGNEIKYQESFNMVLPFNYIKILYYLYEKKHNLRNGHFVSFYSFIVSKNCEIFFL